MSRTRPPAARAARGLAATVAATVVATAAVGTAHAGGHERTYRVTIVNVTPGSQLTPILAAVHAPSASLFTLGEPASDELAILAETGDTAPLRGLLDSLPAVSSVAAVPGPSEGLTFAGERVEFEIVASGREVMSFATMLLPTNDSFAALDSVPLPRYGSYRLRAVGHDAGSEDNDELCENIPGPTCGEGGGGARGEGFVHVGGGVHGIGDLPEEEYDWRNPVASVTITRIR